MKTRFLAISALILFALTSLPAQPDPEVDPDFVVVMPKVSTPPVIDGVIDQIWHAERALPIERVQSGEVEDEADLSAVWYGLYDDENFYFLIDIHDQFLESEAGAAIWRNDRIEVYFNMDNAKPAGDGHSGDNRQYAFHWNKPDEEFINNGIWDGIEWTYLTTDYGYVTEVKIPFTTLNTGTTLVAGEGFEFGMDIAINDNDGSSLYDSVTYWWNSILAAEWSNMDGAGTIGLGAPFDGNYAPVLAEMDVQEAAEGTASDIVLTATDANASDTLAFSSSDLPSFASLVTNPDGTATITVDAVSGDAEIYFFTVTVSDGAKEDSIDLTLIVKDPAVASQSPVFASIDDVTVSQGNLLSVDVSVTDIDSLSVDIFPNSLPEFVTFQDNGDKTGTLALNPGFDVTPQSYLISLMVEDEDGNSDQLDFDVIVAEAVKLTEFYCDPVLGNIENDGSADAPWPSLEEVFEAGKLFSAGDVIYLRSGFHGEPVVSGENLDTVYIMAETDAMPTMASISISGSSWHVSGLEVSRSYAPTFTRATMVSINGDHNTVSDSSIYTVPDISAWVLADWLGKPSNGVSIGGTYNLLENCEVLNTRFAVSVSGSFNTARGNHIQNFSGDGMRGLGNDLLFEYNYVADNYNVDGNHDDGFQSWSSGSEGVGSGVVYRITLRGNTIVQSTDPTRGFQGSLQGIGCFDGMYEDWLIENNMVIVNQFHGISLYGAINCKILNNTVIDLWPDQDPFTTWITIVDHKNYGNAGNTPEENAYYRGSGNIVRNNLASDIRVGTAYGDSDNNLEVATSELSSYFVDHPYNLHLAAGSPAINTGSSVETPTIDIDGDTRPGLGDLWDIGADEFIGSWHGYPLDAPNYVDTGSYLGGIWVEHDPWVYFFDLELWGYIGPFAMNDNGTWIFFMGAE